MTRTTRTVTKTAARGTRGVVVSHCVEASEAGAAVFRAGGNAFDAAVATSFVAAVRETPMNGIGGVGALIAHSAATGETTEINFYGRTPSGLAEDVFEPYLLPSTPDNGRGAFGWRPVKDSLNERGPLSVGVPTHVSGLAELHDRHGSMPWDALLQPAVELARQGFAPDEQDIFWLATHLDILQRYEEIHRVFFSEGMPIPEGFYQGEGRPLKQPDLGDTIAAIAAEGPSVFYEGAIGERIAAYVQSKGGALSVEDLRRFEPEVTDGLRGSYKGYEVVTSSGMTGGLTLIEMLNLAEQLELGSLERWSAECLHLLAEIMRQSWTDRFVYVGDPEGSTVPIDAFTDKAYATTLLAGFPRDRAPDRTRPGDPWPFSAIARPPATTFSRDPGGTETTHLAAADGDGNVVTLTQTLGLGFGSCLMIPTTGVNLYDVTMWMNPEPGTPNSVGPWKKQLGHATPVMLLEDGKPVIALGAPGGRRVVTAMFQTIVNIVDFGMDVQEAIGAPRLHCEGADPSDPIGATDRTVLIDDRVPASVIQDLARRNHDVRPVHETGCATYLAMPLGLQFTGDEILGGVDVFRRSVGIGL
jgi:gamma-glutamyltranspeptidase/glutathione hydrolase